MRVLGHPCAKPVPSGLQSRLSERAVGRKSPRRALDWLLLTGTLFGILLPATRAAGTEPPGANTDLVLIIDTSKTMRGLAGGTNIFPEVKASSKELTKELALGDSVTLVAYGTNIRPQPTVTLVTETERMRLFGLIDELRADDDYTYTARALEVGFQEAARLEQAFPNHRQAVVIFTDGINDPPPAMRGKGPRLDEVALPYAGRPWYVFQVQMGPTADVELDNALKENFSNAKIIHDPKGAHLKDLGRQALPPAPVAKVLKWSFEPTQINIVLQDVGKTVTASARLRVPDDLPPKSILARLQGAELPQALEVEAALRGAEEGGISVVLSATAHDTLANSRYGGSIQLSLSPQGTAYRSTPSEIPFVVETRLVPPVWPYWLAWVAAVAVLAGGAFAAYRTWSKRRLFGELEYWLVKHPEQINKIPDLSRLGTKAGLGGGSITLPGAATRVGTLRTRVVDGERHVVVVAAPDGFVTHAGKTHDELVLYDADSFELGGWAFRYPAHRRPLSRRPRSPESRSRTPCRENSPIWCDR
jgi:hypothetical protein